MTGQIIKILSDKCYVKTTDGVKICTIRGKFHILSLTPLVGDMVIFDNHKLVINEILPRRNTIIRPPVSNIDQALIVTSFKEPELSCNLIDKLIVELEFNKIKPIICLTKKDLIKKEEILNYKNIIKYYQKIGYQVLYNNEINLIQNILKNKTTVFIGQTGAGKSTLLNRINPSLNLATGEISRALSRGKHTTRHVEIIEMFEGKVLDTPGFSALKFDNMTNDEIKNSFIEFKSFPCIYKDCSHTNEMECMVKKAVLEGKILKSRYEDYLKFRRS